MTGFIIALLAFIPINATASEKQAKQFIDDLGNQAISIIGNGKYSDKKKEEKLISLFTQSVDTDWVGRFVLGKYWRRATVEQKDRYRKLYKEYLIASYVPRFREYTNQNFLISGVNKEREKEYLVKTEITSPDQPSINVSYRIRQKDTGFKIIDVIAEGVSLITTQRTEFSSLISRTSIDMLLQKLAAKTKQLKGAMLTADASNES